jgi:hypothetical protein
MSTLEQWTTAVCADLGLDPGTADPRAVLDLAREVAHSVDRPAAPLTAYLAGVAIGRGMDAETVTALILNRARAWAGQSAAAESKKPAEGQERA